MISPRRFWAVFVARNKEFHYGQVLPLEDVKAVFALCSSIARIACGDGPTNTRPAAPQAAAKSAFLS